MCDNDYDWNPATCRCENGKYLGNVIDSCDEIIDTTRTVPINLNKR